MKRTTTLAIIVLIVVAAFVSWRVWAMNNQPVNHFAVLRDPSFSYAGGCDSVAGSVEEILHGAGVSPRSKLILLVLGNRATANEPRELGRYEMPSRRKVIEGQHASRQRQAALLREIVTKCSSVRPTSISPIFMGVKQAVAALRSEGCGVNSQCQLRVSSDLEENVEDGIKRQINGTRRRSTLPGKLNNQGIDITFCGYVVTAGWLASPSGREARTFAARGPAREDRLQQTWRSLFKYPERVEFEPFCPKSTTELSETPNPKTEDARESR